MPKISVSSSLIRQIAVCAAALIIAAGLFNFTRALTTCWRISALPGVPPAGCPGGAVKVLETPVIVSDQITPALTSTPEFFASQDIRYPTWDGGSRINILFVGFRGGDPIKEDCPFCTDTLILLTVDPTSKTAGMLSIPRDLWVNIPGFGYSRINTAWTLGRGSKLPGGGAALTMKTVSQFIGVPIDYYVQVDFDTFVDIIDLIGGVDIDNNETLLLDPVSHGRDYPKFRLTCCGVRHLNGREALAYARCRYEKQGCKGGDIRRAERQQKVIFGIRDKVFSPENFPHLLSQAPRLYNTFSAGIHTNMALDDAVKLATLVREIPKKNIKNDVIDMVIGDSVILGGQKASILRPIPDQVRILRDEIFTTGGPASPLAEGELAALMQADGARIRLMNGTATRQLEERTATYLSAQGLRVTELGSTKPQNQTIVFLYSPKLYTLQFVLEIFGIDRSPQIRVKPDPSQTVDVEIWLGTDWLSKLPPDY